MTAVQNGDYRSGVLGNSRCTITRTGSSERNSQPLRKVLPLSPGEMEDCTHPAPKMLTALSHRPNWTVEPPYHDKVAANRRGGATTWCGSRPALGYVSSRRYPVPFVSSWKPAVVIDLAQPHPANVSLVCPFFYYSLDSVSVSV